MRIVNWITWCFLSLGAWASDPPIKLGMISVTPGLFTIRSGAMTNQRLSKTEIQSFPLIDNDIMRAAQIFPGVVSHDYSARFNVRGGERDEVLVLLDGMELVDPFHLQDFGGAISIIDLNLIQRFDLMMGGFPAKYGDKMSSVVTIVTDSEIQEQISGLFGFDLLNASAQFKGPIGSAGNWLLSARRGYFDLLLDLIKAKDVPRPTYSDLFSKLYWEPNGQNQLTLNTLIALDSNQMTAEETDINLISDYSNSLIWGKWRREHNSQFWTQSYIFSGSQSHNQHYNDNRSDQRQFTFAGGKIESTYLRAKNLEIDHKFDAGLEWRWTESVYDYRLTQSFRQLDASGWDLKAYLQHEWQILSYLALNAGVRGLYREYRITNARPTSSGFDLSPRLSLALRPYPSIVIRLAWGRYHQPVNLTSIPIARYSTLETSSEVASHYIFGVELGGDLVGLRDKLLIKAELYRKKYDHLVGEVMDLGRKSQQLQYPDQGSAIGGDVFLCYLLTTRLTASLGYGYGRAKATVVDSEITYFRDYDQRHSISVNLGCQFSYGWRLHTAWSFHTGRPYTKIKAQLVSLDDQLKDCQASYGRINIDRLPNYHSLDFRLIKTKSTPNFSLNWYIQVLNVYNHQNIHEYAINSVYNDNQRLIDCQVKAEPLLPVLPLFGIEVQF